MAIGVGKPIEKHLYDNSELRDTQSGFTEGGRIENNIFILNYCIQKSYQDKHPLIVISVDFSKAFDSIKREAMIETLIDYKVHPKIINIVANIYKGDRTFVKLEERNTEIPITSGIRQGCTGSTTLFKMITYRIMQSLDKLNKGYRDTHFKISSLFFADDGLILATSVQDAEVMIDTLINSAEHCGLSINIAKSKIIVFNMKDQPRSIRNIQVNDEIKYLGVLINNTKNCFNNQKEKMLNTAREMSNLTYPVIANCCNKVMIGKTFWKQIALPNILYGSNVIYFTKQELEKLQRIENVVYRKILGAPNYAQVATLRGEIGSSSVERRIAEGQINYLKYTLKEGGNDLVKRTMEETISQDKAKWIKSVESNLKKIKINVWELNSVTKEEIKRRFNSWETDQWRKEIESKPSLEIYGKWKQEIKGEERLYDNRPASVIFYKCRTNNLPLKDRNRFSGGDTRCDLCGAEEENLIHFVLWCPAYSDNRKAEKLLQQPYIENEKNIVGKYLFNNENPETAKETLFKFWKSREKEVENRQTPQHAQHT